MRVYSSEYIYRGRVVTLRVDEVDALKGGVVIIAQPAPRTVVLVRQHRHAVSADLWEVPAGMLGVGEELAVAAQRELLEETGYRAERVRYLWAAYSTPGFCNELLHFFVAEGLTPGEQRLDDNEDIEVRTFALDDAWAMVERDELRDAKSQIALAWAHRQ
jgi:ADP-ribose pyrophosphatase